MKSKWFYVLCSIVVYMIYGGAYLPIKILSKALSGDVMQLLSFRFVTAALAAIVLCFAGVIRLQLKGKKKLPVLVAGFVYPIIYYIFETYGIQNFPSGTAGVLMATAPVVATILAMGIFKEFPCALQWGSIGLSILGAVILNLGGGMAGGTTTGLVLILLTVLACAFQSITLRWAALAGYTPGEITLVSACMGALFFTSISLAQHIAAGTLTGYLAPLFNLQNIACILYLGVVSSVGAVTVMALVIGKLPIAVACGVAGVASVVAVLVGVFVLNEAFSAVYLLGMAAVMAGSFGVSRFQKEQIKTDCCTDAPNVV